MRRSPRFETDFAARRTPPRCPIRRKRPRSTRRSRRRAHAAASLAPAKPNEQPAATVPVAGLAVEIAAQPRAGKSRFEIRLDPPELGRIDVRLDMDKDGNVDLAADGRARRNARPSAPRRASARARAQPGGPENGRQCAGIPAARPGLRQQRANNRQNGREAAQIIIPDDEATVLEAKRGYGRLLGLGNGLDISV